MGNKPFKIISPVLLKTHKELGCFAVMGCPNTAAKQNQILATVVNIVRAIVAVTLSQDSLSLSQLLSNDLPQLVYLNE